MRYMLLMADGETLESGPADVADVPRFAAWTADVEARGITHVGERLRPPVEAVTVRVRDGRTLITDGPFADTKEHVAGYELIEAADLDEAIEVAAGHPSSDTGAIEIRPFHVRES